MRFHKLAFQVIIAFLLLSCDQAELTIKTSNAKIMYDITYPNTGSFVGIVTNANNEIFLYRYYFVMKLDKNANVIWQRSEKVERIVPTKDGGCIAFDYSPSFGFYEADGYMKKISSTGEIEWEKTGSDYFLSVVYIDENDEIYGIGDIEQDGFVLKPKFFKYSKDGELISSKYLMEGAGLNSSRSTCLIKTSKNTFVLGAQTTVDYEIYDVNYSVIEFDINGDNPTVMNFGGSNYDYLLGITETTDDGLLLTGFSKSYDGDVKSIRSELMNKEENAWVVKLNNNREIEWEKLAGGTNGYSVFIKSKEIDNGFKVSYISKATDFDFAGKMNPKSGYFTFDKKGNLIDNKYIEVLSLNNHFTDDGELIVLVDVERAKMCLFCGRIIKFY